MPLLYGEAVGSFEAFLIYPGLDPGDSQAQHGGQEMLYILTGVVDVLFTSHTVRVSAGDCVHFPGYLQHRLCRIGRARAKALLVLSNN